MSGHVAHDYDDPSAPPRLCQNCATALKGPYCTHCGQHDVDYHRSFWHLTHDLLENLFHFEGKFFASVAWLLAKPGKLTVEFNAGRRQSQLNPLRFYIFVTVLFFLVVHFANDGHLFKFDRKEADAQTAKLREFTEHLARSNRELTPAQVERFAELIGEAATHAPGKLDDRTVEAILARVKQELPASPPPEAATKIAPTRDARVASSKFPEFARSLDAKIKSGELTWSRFVDELERRVPTLLFLGMPVFALFLKLFYRRSGRYYIEHLIFSIHLHTWAFLALMVSFGYFALASLGPPWIPAALAWLFALWLIGYTVVAFRTVYGQSWLRTGVKLGLLAMGYVFTLTWIALVLILFTVWSLASS